MSRIILISGGVVSGVGKGVITSSLGYILREFGISTTCIKIDPYLNIDAGTMSPYEHGEVFVLDDGSEVDLDFGNYERFLNVSLSGDHSFTSGKVFQKIIEKERAGHFLGKTVQLTLQVSEFIKEEFLRVAKLPLKIEKSPPEVCLIELGGTPGDIESMMFTDSLRKTAYELGKDRFLHLHVTFIPELSNSREQKSRPAQQSVMNLRKMGLPPDIIICRSFLKVSEKIREKMSMMCMVPIENVLSMHDVHSTFEVPQMMVADKLPQKIFKQFKMENTDCSRPLKLASEIVEFESKKERLPKLKIAFIGKYTGGSDCYLSLIAALKAAARKINVNLVLDTIDPLFFEKKLKNGADLKQLNKRQKNDDSFKDLSCLKKYSGILIPGGFGNRGTEGKILAAEVARENDIPYLGICLGMQIGVIEFARNVLKLEKANSSEFAELNDQSVVIFMPEINKNKMGGSMRVGKRKILIEEKSKLSEIYGGKREIYERHRHRYEVNKKFLPSFEEKLFRFTGKDEKGERMEAFEYVPNRFHLGVQFHPEFLNKPVSPKGVIEKFLIAAFEHRRHAQLN